MHSIPRAGFGRRGRVLAAAATALVAAVGLAACSSGGTAPSSSAAAGAPTQKITIAVPTAPVSLDPALQNVDPTNNWFIQLTYDPLIRLAPDGSLQPDLATSWKYLDTKSTQFQLTLRQGVNFSDGTPVTADAVVKSLQYFIASGTNGGTWLGKDTVVSATDASTVLITTSSSNSVLPYLLTQRTHLGSVVNPTGLATPAQLKSSSYGAGPYILDTSATLPNDTYVYKPNAAYWDQTKIHWAEIDLKVTGNNAASLQAVQNGEASLMRGDVTTAKAASGNSALNVNAVPLGLYGVGYLDRQGTISAPLANVKVRQALSYAIDRKSITQAVWDKYGTAGNDLTLQGFAGFDQATSDSYAYDPAKAKQLLAEAGYPNGFTVTMQSTNAGGADVPAQAIVQNWAQIGVTVKLDIYSDTSQLIANTLAKKYAIGVYYYGAQQQYLQAKSFFNGGANQYNPFVSSDDQINTLLTQAAAEPDATKQAALYQQVMQRAMVDQVWFSNVAYTPSVMIWGKGLTGTDFGSLTGSPDIAWNLAPTADFGK